MSRQTDKFFLMTILKMSTISAKATGQYFSGTDYYPFILSYYTQKKEREGRNKHQTHLKVVIIKLMSVQTECLDECPTECLTECPTEFPNECPIECPNECPTECPTECQLSVQLSD